MGAAIYQDTDGTVLWRDMEGENRTTGTMISGADGRLYLIVQVVRLVTDRSDICRIQIERVD